MSSDRFSFLHVDAVKIEAKHEEEDIKPASTAETWPNIEFLVDEIKEDRYEENERVDNVDIKVEPIEINTSKDETACPNVQVGSTITKELQKSSCKTASSANNIVFNQNKPMNTQKKNYPNSTSIHRQRLTLCPICFQDVTSHFPRHLLRHHPNHEKVIVLRSLEPRSKQRLAMVASLRKQGYFQLKLKRNIVNPMRTPKAPINKYYFCNYCLGHYSSKSFCRQHRRNCTDKPTDEAPINQASPKPKKIRSILSSSIQKSNEDFIAGSRLTRDVFETIRPDEVIAVARNDPLICLYGERNLRQGKYNIVSTSVLFRIRTLARLLIALRELSGEIRVLSDGLKPSMFNTLISATKLISGCDRKSNIESPTLARRIGIDLKLICNIALKMMSEEISVPKTPYNDKTERKMEIRDLRVLIERNWRSTLGIPPVQELKRNSTVPLPLPADIQLLDEFLLRRCDEAYENLKKNPPQLPEHYQMLTESVLIAVIMFNRRSMADIESLKVDVYNRDLDAADREQLLGNSPYETHKILNKKCKTVFAEDGCGRTSNLPIFFPSQIQKYLTYTLNVRNEMDTVSKRNPYLFAGSGMESLSAAKAISRLGEVYGLKCWELLNSTKSRKYIATTLQIIAMDEGDLKKIRTDGDYSWTKNRIHQDRSPLDIHEALRIRKLSVQTERRQRNDTEQETEYVKATKGNSHGYIENGGEHQNKKISPHKKNKKTESTVSSQTFIVGRIKWTEEEKNIVKEYFSRHIQQKITPKKKECEALLQLYGDELINKDWVRVKTFVYNTFRNKDIDS